MQYITWYIKDRGKKAPIKTKQKKDLHLKSQHKLMTLKRE